ncbi:MULTISPECIES: hypothetical protein [unclassified Paenibacillus]|uniref:hypothetical protein n=1 Tax=unclassified Paenibacillus TaxID=185978 RepID=UPI00020D740D|nr:MULTISPECIES: hypothetical protein [unclassified Paenibacillus]EGL17514.1 hypothetical protein HMPREF9413_5415 [Paenibacillus sp. HGF7]EPD81255.1 hypothetical protein HMPREF1207_05012 [Paenibacillus sp. HGH0039]
MKKAFFAIAVLLFLILVLSGCALFEPETETIVIPSQEEKQTENEGIQPFKVKTIYRLPDEFTNAGQLLGWSGKDSVIASNKKVNMSEQTVLKRMAPPYEKSEIISGIQMDSPLIELSPDGSLIREISVTRYGTKLKLISLKDGKETEVANFSNNKDLYLQNVAWSNNNQYLCYLVIDPIESGKAFVHLLDVGNQSSTTYTIKNYGKGKSLTKINVSDDGHSVLLTAFQTGKTKKNIIMLGTVNGKSIDIQYEHQSDEDQVAWLNNDQFVFLGTDGTLFEYDQRTKELSVLLEKVEGFKLSKDRKCIAYSTYDQDTIYAGKIQGNNVLSNEPVYHGLKPSQMYWSPGEKGLLVYGQKFYSPSSNTQTMTTDGQILLIEFQ